MLLIYLDYHSALVLERRRLDFLGMQRGLNSLGRASLQRALIVNIFLSLGRLLSHDNFVSAR